MPLEDEVLDWLKRRGHAGQFIIFIIVIGLVIIGAANVITAVDTITSEVKSIIHNLEHKELSDNDLKKQALELANRLFSFAGDRILNDPSKNNIGEVNKSQWGENTKRMVNYSQETTEIYNTRYLSEVIRTKQEFSKRNLTDPQLDQFYDRPTNPIGIQIVATRFLELANRLP
jgi:hypothetical protein